MFVNLYMYDVCTENVYRLSCTLHRIQILYCTQCTLYIKMYNVVQVQHYAENTADFLSKMYLYNLCCRVQRDCIYLSSVHRQGIYRLKTVKFVQCTLYIHYTEYKFTLYSAMYTVEGQHLFVKCTRTR